MTTRSRCATIIVLLLGVSAAARPARETQAAEAGIYKDPSRPIPERVSDLVSRMTLEEKVSQLMNGAAAIPRLDVPEYDWWNEALHGVARAGLATVFPQAIGLAASWDEPLIREVATTISTEARAKHNAFAAEGRRGLYQGLTFWSPNINIFRDPRWGRGMETSGPFAPPSRRPPRRAHQTSTQAASVVPRNGYSDGFATRPPLTGLYST